MNIIKKLKTHLLSTAHHLIGKNGLWKVVKNKNELILCLAYHEVCTDVPDYLKKMDIFITPEHFEKHIQFIVNNFECISIKELFKSSQKEKIRVLITFDDGYKGNFDYAFPILKKYNCPATIFITTGYIDRAILPWRAGLHYLLHNNKESSIRDTINFQREKIKKDQNVLNWSKQNFSSELYKTINDLLIQEPGINKLYDVFLTWEQIRTMYQSSLISFGLHSVTHQIMSKLIFDEQVQEIVTGVESFWKNLQIEPDGFAYPFGGKSHFNQDTIAALKRNLPGKPGFMLGNGVNKVGYTNNYTIQRLCVHDWTTSELSNSMFTNHLKVNN